MIRRWFSLGLGASLMARKAHAACSLCPEGRLSPAPNLLIPYSSVDGESDLTCQQLEAVAREIQEDDDCYAFAELTGYATLCRCHVHAQTCTFCSDGTNPESIMEKGGVCAEEFLYLPYMTLGSDACARTQHLAHLQCGCSEPPRIPEDACTLCADDSLPTADLTTFVDDSTTCADYMAIATGTDQDTAKCYKLQAIGRDACGCTAPLEHCSVCADGSDPLYPDRWVDAETTCRDLNGLVSPFSPICPHIQASGYFICGCPTPPDIMDPQGPCTLCAGGEDFKEYHNLDQDHLDVVTCSDSAASVYTASRSSESCRFHQAYAYLYCGCETMPPLAPTPSCTMCPGGLEPMFPQKIVPGTANMTCSTANNLVTHLFDSDICKDLIELQEACGCPEPEPCTLCQDQETLIPNPQTAMVQTSSGYLSCQELDRAARNIEIGMDHDAFLQKCNAFRENYRGGCCTDNVFLGQAPSVKEDGFDDMTSIETEVSSGDMGPASHSSKLTLHLTWFAAPVVVLLISFWL